MIIHHQSHVSVAAEDSQCHGGVPVDINYFQGFCGFGRYVILLGSIRLQSGVDENKINFSVQIIEKYQLAVTCELG